MDSSLLILTCSLSCCLSHTLPGAESQDKEVARLGQALHTDHSDIDSKEHIDLQDILKYIKLLKTMDNNPSKIISAEHDPAKLYGLYNPLVRNKKVKKTSESVRYPVLRLTGPVITSRKTLPKVLAQKR